VRQLAIPIWITATIIYLVVAIAWIVKVSQGSPTIEDFSAWIAGVAQPVAVAWFIGAYLLQRSEIRETRQELAQQSEALKRSAAAQDRQTVLQLRELLRADVNAFLLPYRYKNSIPDEEDTIAHLAYQLRWPERRFGYFEEVVLKNNLVATAKVLVGGFETVLRVADSADSSGWIAHGLANSPTGVVCQWLREEVDAGTGGAPSQGRA